MAEALGGLAQHTLMWRREFVLLRDIKTRLGARASKTRGFFHSPSCSQGEFLESAGGTE